MRRGWFAVALILSAGTASADGMTFRLLGAEAEVQATEQRAILYKPDAQADWQLHIQPVFDRQAGAAAWVVPFDVLPVVSEGSTDFFDQLELLTTPVFLRVCITSPDNNGCFGCSDAGDKMGGDGELVGADALVTVWERDQVGGLDYVLLSAADGDSLATWLEAEGFEIGAGASALLSTFETEGVFWFAARLAVSADPAKPLPPVRFDLPGVDEPTYPLRLTTLGVPEGQRLGLTLWVIHPEYAPAWAPSSRGAFPDRPSDRQEYDEAVESFFDQHPGQLLNLYGGRPADLGAANMRICPEMLDCLSYEDVGLEKPQRWCPEILTILGNGQWVARYEGRLGPDSLDSDLVMERREGGLDWVSNIYEEITCKQEARVDWILLLAIGLGWLTLRRRSV